MEKYKNEKLNVLVVEDDEDDYILTTDLLSEVNPDRFNIDWAKTYEEALQRIGDRFDVCLLDYRLGPRTGLELLHEMQEKGYDAPIILLTGQGDLELDVQAMRAGAADYLVKGQIRADDMERSIRYAVQHKQMERERVALARELAARQQAEAANKAKDDFLAMVSHELRNPLNSLLGWVTILRSNKDNESIYNRAIEAIERSTQTQIKLVSDLLDITRIANGSLWLENEPIPLVPIIEAAIDQAYPSANSKSIGMHVRLDHSDVLVSGDQNRLQQVVSNLLQNAVKFTPEGGSISVSCERHDGSAVINITDTGIGIGSEFLPFIFERYRQGDGSATKRGGLGLGLAIARHIVELHRGSITADSPGEGRGTTFTIKLPLIGNN